MIYLNFLVMMCLVVGLIAVASNPSPYYAALGLVFSALCGCCVLVCSGISFLSLVLLLIYLGGMLVVFAYSASLAAEPYPEAWGSWSVLIYSHIYMLVIILYYLLTIDDFGFEYLFYDLDVGFSVIVSDCSGVGSMYSSGVLFLMFSGWILYLTLFVVLEVTRGLSRVSLRAV